MNEENTNWGQSVAGVCIRDGKVLLARHTYGGGKGLLIIPGGYVQYGESPQDAVVREYMEEVGVSVEPKSILGIRFNVKDWYVVYSVEYVSGIARSDGDENDEVLWLDVAEALQRDDVPGLTKQMIQCALTGNAGLKQMEYESRHNPCSLWGVYESE